ncbi:hypothetical protein NFI96_024113, partial [Prochilodus magdalenae]
LQKCLDSYLRNAPRGTDSGSLSSSPAVAEMQRSLHRSVFMVFLRMATHKESKDNFITPAVFGEIIYDNFLFDIPKILDLCVLFGRGNPQLLHKMIENIFNQQPSYYGDLNEIVPSIIQVFDTILEKCGLQSEDTAASEPLKLNTYPRRTTMTMTEEDLADLVLYLCDTCTTIHSFLDIFPDACSTFHQHGFLTRLSSFYEMAVPDLEKAVTKRNFDKCHLGTTGGRDTFPVLSSQCSVSAFRFVQYRRKSRPSRGLVCARTLGCLPRCELGFSEVCFVSLQEDLWRRVCHSRRRMVEITHLLLQHTCLQPILEGSEHTASFVEDFLQTFTAFLQEKRFLADYDEQFPVADDVSLLQQAFPHLDDTRTSYLLQAVESAWDSTGKKRPLMSSSANQSGDSKAYPDTRPALMEAAGGEATIGEELRGAEAMMDIPRKGANGAVCTVSAGELESLLSHIRDLLPDLGEGFLLACLEEYGYDGELVINNILEDRLAPELNKLDRAMPRPVKEAPPPVIDSRSNVFDDDEFDVFNRDQVDMSRVWKGKRRGENARAMLDDKRHVDEQRERYRSYQTVVEEVPISTDQAGNQGGTYAFDDYDDEYDDTYDINQVGANDLDEDDELLNRRPFTTPQVLRTAGRPEGEERGEEEEEEEEKDETKRDQFVQDPAVLRERAEARRISMQSRKGHRPPPQSHVVGGPKGRGQTQETVLDRRRKEMNKSRGANHNRRAMADRKRNKGMIPS